MIRRGASLILIGIGKKEGFERKGRRFVRELSFRRKGGKKVEFVVLN